MPIPQIPVPRKPDVFVPNDWDPALAPVLHQRALDACTAALALEVATHPALVRAVKYLRDKVEATYQELVGGPEYVEALSPEVAALCQADTVVRALANADAFSAVNMFAQALPGWTLGDAVLAYANVTEGIAGPVVWRQQAQQIAANAVLARRHAILAAYPGAWMSSRSMGQIWFDLTK